LDEVATNCYQIIENSPQPFMTPTPRYVVITPVRNEERNFPSTIASFVAQSIKPICWLIVDDGSTDATPSIAREAAAQHPWIKVIHRADRGFRQPGTGVIEAFYEGYSHVRSLAWDYLVKFDGDLAFDTGFFEGCFQLFDRDLRLGIGGGLICQPLNGTLVAEWAGDPDFHVRGATKIYRRECWEQIDGLVKAPGWDTIDELKAKMLGWETRTFQDLKIHQLKITGSADGSWRNWVKNGLANYITGYHPLFMAAKCASRLLKPPIFIGAGCLAWGFLSGYLRGIKQVADADLIQYIRHQQWRKLTFRSNIWG
jgi:poly-beta-1,6-N-acetyl-D-glucosamine synthase